MREESGAPRSARRKSRATANVALEGLAVLADYEQSLNGQVVFRGHGLLTYDSDGAVYLLHWFDHAGGGIRTFHGDFTGEVLTVSYFGHPCHVRLSCDFGEPGRLRSRLETSPDGITWGSVFQGEYTRHA